MDWLSVDEVLPTRGRKVFVQLEDGTVTRGVLIHNDWVFNEKVCEKFNIHNMAERDEFSKKIRYWSY